MEHLVTPRLLMRPFASGDLSDLHALLCDIQVTLPPSMEETRISLEIMISAFDKNHFGMFAVIERKEKRFIGLCGLQPLENSGLTELRFCFAPSTGGKGYATEAAMEVLRAAFGDWELEKIVALAETDGKSSARVLEKIGMVNSGNGKFYGKDVILYSVEKRPKPAGPVFQSNYRHNSRLSMPAL
jgi:ribosomal-protein-alanine N-acetyltransferase